MKYIILGLLIFIGICLMFIFVYAYKSKSFFKTLFLNSILGIILLLIINLLRKYIGAYLPLNYITVFSSGVLGIPAVIGLLILNLIFLI